MKSFYVGIKGVFEKDGKVLVLRRKGSDGVVFYDMPGGRINEGEDIEETLHRELEEELGVTGVTIGKLVTACNLPGYNHDDHGLMLLFYQVAAPDFRIKLSDEHVGYEWVTTDDVQRMIDDGQSINGGIQQAVSLVSS